MFCCFHASELATSHFGATLTCVDDSSQDSTVPATDNCGEVTSEFSDDAINRAMWVAANAGDLLPLYLSNELRREGRFGTVGFHAVPNHVWATAR